MKSAPRSPRVIATETRRPKCLTKPFQRSAYCAICNKWNCKVPTSCARFLSSVLSRAPVVIEARIVCNQAVRCLYTDTGCILVSYRRMWQTKRVDDGRLRQKIGAGWARVRGVLISLSQLFDEDFAFVIHSFDGHLDGVFFRGLLE